MDSMDIDITAGPSTSQLPEMDVDPGPSTSQLPKNQKNVSKIQICQGCEHALLQKNDAMLEYFEMICYYYVACLPIGSGKKKVKDCVCGECEEILKEIKKDEIPRLLPFPIHMCLTCGFSACYRGYNDTSHIKEHLKKEEHPFAVDVDYGQLYCLQCNDYIYDADFMRILKHMNTLAREKNRSMPSVVKAILGEPEPFDPSPELLHIMQIQPIFPSSEIDVVGIFNIGKYTCYVSVIVQSLLHAPVFREYLLSSQHECRSAFAKRPMKKICLICEMSNLLQEVLSQKGKPLVLHGLLTGFFLRRKHYNNGLDKDVVECMRDIIVNFHDDEIQQVKASELEEPLENFAPCDCIIHQLFSFEIQKDSLCSACKIAKTEKKFQSIIYLNQVDKDALGITMNSVKTVKHWINVHHQQESCLCLLSWHLSQANIIIKPVQYF